MKANYLVTVVLPYEGLGLQQDPLECTQSYFVKLNPRERKDLQRRLEELTVEDTDDYEYEYEDHYGILAYRVEKIRPGNNQHSSLLTFLDWRTPKPDGPQGMLLNKGKEEA